MKELKGNLLRFVVHTFTETCGDGIHAMIDDAVKNRMGTCVAFCRVRREMSSNELVKYKLTVTLEEVE